MCRRSVVAWRARGARWVGTCDVPQLQPHRLLVPVEHFERKVHADGGAVVGAEVVVHVALDDAGLAHAEVPDHQDLVEMLLLVAVLHGGRGGRDELSMNPPELSAAERRGSTGEQLGPRRPDPEVGGRGSGRRRRGGGRGGAGSEGGQWRSGPEPDVLVM